MNFHSLAKVEKPDWFIDIAFRRATDEANKTRSEFTNKPKILKSRAVELTKVTTITRSLSVHLKGIIKAYPQIDELAEFYKELVKCSVDYDQLKHSLGAIIWAQHRIETIGGDYANKIRRCKDFEAMNKYRREYYGRSASVIKKIGDELAYLETARKILKEFPSIKTGIPTIVIAGFPNVGKTTLLKALTGSAPEVAPYPFTTKQLMLGYANKTQFIDTPGLLDRPLQKRNKIELQAILALKHLAKKIIFIIDPSESCGYPVKEQVALLKEIEKNFGIPMIVVLNKTDIAPKEVVERLKKELHAIPICAETKKGLEELEL